MTTSTYEYAASGLRVKKVEGATVTQQLLDGPSVTTEYDDLGTRKAFYLQNPQKIDEFFSATVVENGQMKEVWPLVDGLGSVYGLADKSGAVVSTFNFEVYGGRTQVSGVSELTFGFTGREHDYSKTLYFRDRYTDPQIGIWLQLDRVSWGAESQYQYAKGNPSIQPFQGDAPAAARSLAVETCL